jgi:hypothetical protein
MLETGNPYVRQIVKSLKEENKFLSAADLRIDNRSYALTLEGMSKFDMITGVAVSRDQYGNLSVSITDTPKLTSNGETIYQMSKLMGKI